MKNRQENMQLGRFVSLLGLIQVLLVSVPLFSAPCDAFKSSPVGDPESAIKGLVTRLLGEKYVNQFTYEVIPQSAGHDTFEIDGNSQPPFITLRGNNGVSLAMALNYYLKYMCNNSVSWGRDGSGNNLKLPAPLPMPKNTTRIVSPHRFRYYQNVVTVSYSMAWWDFKRWQQEIDWMALNGLNFILSFTGQEYVWQKFYRSVGLTDDEIKTFFSGPAFLAWQRMGNLRNWGGPLDDAWIVKQSTLQKQIVEQIRSFGMINILPGFSGHVPKGIQRVYPNAKLIRSANWNNFGDDYSEDFLLEPTDPLFVQLGQNYYKMVTETYGNDHYFNTDTYNEMLPSSSDPTFLKETNAAIYQAMTAVDSDAVFVMQGWLFRNDASFWGKDQVKAFLSGVPDDHMVILDLSAEQAPVWPRTESFFGKPFIWCLLHNYGGARGIYGNLTTIANDPIDAMKAPNSTMVGVGMTPEAIEHNPVVYDLMGEMSWRSEKVTDLVSWLDLYASRRYGNWTTEIHKAWSLLLQGVYQFHFSWDLHSFTLRAPELKLKPYTVLDSGKVSQAWQFLVAATNKNPDFNSNNGPFKYDLVDIGRQVLVNTFTDLYLIHEQIYTNWVGNKTTTNYVQASSNLDLIGKEMMAIMNDLDGFLGSDTNFLLGHWISEARLSAASNSDKAAVDNLEFNARNQITTWGPNENINDYAGKDWSGLMKDYHAMRWDLYTSSMATLVKMNEEINIIDYRITRFKLEMEWNRGTNASTSYPTWTVGDSVDMAASLMENYTRTDEYMSENYIKLEDTDIPSNNLYGIVFNLWGNSSNQWAYLCEVNPKCMGFSYSTGLVFKQLEDTKTVSTFGTTLYLKKQHFYY